MTSFGELAILETREVNELSCRIVEVKVRQIFPQKDGTYMGFMAV